MSTLLGTNLSPFVRKVLILSEEAGISIEHRDDVMPFPKSEELLAANPLGKIPAFVDGDLGLGESSVICAYLDKQAGGTALYPSNSQDYAQALWWEKYGDSEVIMATAIIFFNRVVAPLMGQETDQEAIDKALNEDQPRVFGFLNEKLAGKQFAVGNNLSIADIAIFSPFVNLMLAGEKIDGEKYPELRRYLLDLKKRPAFANVLQMAKTDIE